MRRSSVIHQNAGFPIARGISTAPSAPFRPTSMETASEFFVVSSFASIALEIEAFLSHAVH